jgi:phosphotransferase system HPr (HPr) family protein
VSTSSVRLVVRNPSGIHARPAAQFVRTAGRFTSTIRVANLSNGKGPVDAKSILSVLPLGVSKGTEIEIIADGDDAEEAVGAIREAVETGLGEGLDAASS